MNAERAFWGAVYALGLVMTSGAHAQVTVDTFGSGQNEFNIEFVTISGDASNANGTDIGGLAFQDPVQKYRIARFEITNSRWERFRSQLNMPVAGQPNSAYNESATFTEGDVPTNEVSWYEAAQFVNWLNISRGHHPAYKFTGTQGTADYTLDLWTAAESDGGTNFYRHKDAFYFLPTEHEWVKAAYWNGLSFQTYGTRPGESLHQGDGISGTGWNYYDGGYATDPPGPWKVGSGSEELNGTYDMMGNLWEWMESVAYGAEYEPDARRRLAGGIYSDWGNHLAFGYENSELPYAEDSSYGFRVAAKVPEPSTLPLLMAGLGTAWMRRRT